MAMKVSILSKMLQFLFSAEIHPFRRFKWEANFVRDSFPSLRHGMQCKPKWRKQLWVSPPLDARGDKELNDDDFRVPRDWSFGLNDRET